MYSAGCSRAFGCDPPVDRDEDFAFAMLFLRNLARSTCRRKGVAAAK